MCRRVLGTIDASLTGCMEVTHMKPTDPTKRFSDLQKQGFMKFGRKNARKAKVAKPIVACDECHDWHVKGKHTKGAITMITVLT